MTNAALKPMSLGFKRAIINISTTDCLMLRERQRRREQGRNKCDGNLAKGRGIAKHAPSVMPEDLAYALTTTTVM